MAIVTVSSGEIKFMMNGSMSALRAYLRGGPYATVICLDDATYLGVAGIPRVTIQVHKGEGLTRRLGPAKDDSFEVDIRMQLWNFSRALADDCDRYRLRKLLGTWVAEENDRPLNKYYRQVEGYLPRRVHTGLCFGRPIYICPFCDKSMSNFMHLFMHVHRKHSYESYFINGHTGEPLEHR